MVAKKSGPVGKDSPARERRIQHLSADERRVIVVLGQRVRAIRNQRNTEALAVGLPKVTIDALANTAGINAAVLGEIERGRVFSLRATASSWRWVYSERSVPFGKYWRSKPLVFSFEPRCQGLCGSQKYTAISVATVNRAWCAIPCPRSHVSVAIRPPGSRCTSRSNADVTTAVSLLETRTRCT